MKEWVPLLVLVALWFSIAWMLKRRGWSGLRRHACAGVTALFGLVLTTSIIMGPLPGSDGKTGLGVKGAVAQDAGASEKDDIEQKAEARKSRDAKLMRLDKKIVAIEHMDLSEPPRVWITLKENGWDEASTFYGFSVDASTLLKKAMKANLIEEGRDVAFILQVDMVASDGDGMSETSQSTILNLIVPATSIADFLADSERSAPSNLLRLSKVEFRRRAGKDVVRAFCASSRFQGPSGVAPSATFCRQSPPTP